MIKQASMAEHFWAIINCECKFIIRWMIGKSIEIYYWKDDQNDQQNFEKKSNSCEQYSSVMVSLMNKLGTLLS